MSITNQDVNLEQYIYQTDTLVSMICDITTDDTKSGDTLAALLFTIYRELQPGKSIPGVMRAVNTIDQALEMLFIESTQYSKAFDAWLRTLSPVSGLPDEESLKGITHDEPRRDAQPPGTKGRGPALEKACTLFDRLCKLIQTDDPESEQFIDALLALVIRCEKLGDTAKKQITDASEAEADYGTG